MSLIDDARDVFNPVTAQGAPRGADMAETQEWAMSVGAGIAANAAAAANAVNIANGAVASVASALSDNAPLVVLVSGQSNTTFARTGTWSPPANVKLWNWNNQNPTSPGTAFIEWPNDLITAFGYVAEQLSAMYPVRTIYMIVMGLGGQPIANWLPGVVSPAVDMFAAITANVPLALTAAGASKIDLFCWWQGEADAALLRIDDYPTNYALVNGRLKSQTWFDDDTPQILFELAPEKSPGGAGTSPVVNHDAMNRTLRAITAQDPVRRLVNTSSLTFDTDHIHTDLVDMPTVGRLFRNAYELSAGVPCHPAKRINHNGSFNYWSVSSPQISIGVAREIAREMYIFNNGTSGCQAERLTHVAGQGQDCARTFLEVRKPSGTGVWGFAGRVKSVDISRFAGRRVVMSVKVRRGGAALSSGVFFQASFKTPGSALGAGAASTLASVVANADTLKAPTFRYLEVPFFVPVGTVSDLQIECYTSTPGGTGVAFHISELQLEAGDVATPFEYRSEKREAIEFV